MRYILTGKEMAIADRHTIENIGILSIVLMERAALSFVNRLEKESIDTKNVLVVCGSGNNGGDGYAIARMLLHKGFEVTVLLLGKESSMSKETSLERQIFLRIGGREVFQGVIDNYSLIVDAIFGVGLSREIKGRYKEVIEKINSFSGRKVSVDIPSGVSSYTGEVLGCAFKADTTITFAALKKGHVFFPGEEYCGKVFIEDIEVDTEIFDENVSYTLNAVDALKFLPPRRKDSHKGDYGRVLVVGGSEGMAGAAAFSAKAALRSGSGLVKIASVSGNRTILQSLVPEAMFLPFEDISEGIKFADVIVLGCGLGKSDEAREVFKTVLKEAKVPVILDADGINLAAENDINYDGGIIFTPHIGEAARLLKVENKELKKIDKRFELLDDFARKNKKNVIVLKDARTIVKQNGEKFFVNTDTSPSLSKGGSGDVLSGIIASLVGQGLDLYKAAVGGVLLHSLAGLSLEKKFGKRSPLALDLIDCLSIVLNNEEKNI